MEEEKKTSKFAPRNTKKVDSAASRVKKYLKRWNLCQERQENMQNGTRGWGELLNGKDVRSDLIL
jgi:hypothetical protein